MSKLRARALLCCATCVLAACASPDQAPARRGSATTGSVTAAGSGAASSKSAPPGGPLLARPTAANGGITPKVCASAVVQAAKIPPLVTFVIDGSGSMCAPFGGSTRWQALRNALLDPNMGLIYRLQSQVKFGALLYDGSIDITLALAGGNTTSLAQNPPCALMSAMNKMDMVCPQLLEVPSAPDNAMAIDAIYPKAELGGSTPTDRAMNHVIDKLIPMVGMQGPDDKKAADVYVILATDGAPNDICVGGAGGDGSAQRAAVIAAVQRGAQAGITTWVISLANGDASLQAHLDEVAKAGAPKDPGARTLSPNNPTELIQTLARLLGGAVGCNISLNGKVTVGQECTGKVQLNGVAQPCCQADAAGAWTCAAAPTPSPSGWRLTDPGTIELLGDSCINFLLGANELISAEFPCEVFSPN